ncbi:sugar phosphate isomerase/epimerase [Citricoccus sp. SGAir0253]|nr:sugar phosphate isomerase/epimerase family protein [Citricoccus sp. SGAir0253]QCU79283.1 sugar phosphate isomerase/epimerase [Citricoccus sp. SGAir0253]
MLPPPAREAAGAAVGPAAPREVPVTLSSSSVFPLGTQDVFAMAEDLGYDGVEVMVTHNSWSQDGAQLNRLAQRHSMPIHSIHAPTLLFTQQVWGSAWNKLAKSADLAREVGAEVVVAHPPFRWQGNYASGFAEGIQELMEATGVLICVENMYPWRAGGREAKMYLPHWDPVSQGYEHVTWDFSHAAIAQEDSLDAFRALGSRLRHVHLTDGTANGKDEHMLPGEGDQPVAEALRFLGESGWDGAVCVEVGTRRAKYAGEREEMLAYCLDFARTSLAAGAATAAGGTEPTERTTA